MADRGTPTYRAWRRMRNRCGNPKEKYYAGRGISICARWNDFGNFLADMGECAEGMTLDRIDTNGNYEPSNCRWATMKQQARNRRSNNRLTFNGRTQTIEEWADEF